MSIIFHESSKTFHLTNNAVSYIIHVMDNGQLENLFYGARIHDKEDFNYLHEEMERSHAVVPMEDTRSILCLQHARQEYAIYGTGDYRSPAMTILQENGSRITEFTYVSHRIFDGKPSMEPMPSTYVESDDEAQTLEILLRDELMGTDLVLTYTIYNDYPVITRHASFTQTGSQTIMIEKAMSTCVDFIDMEFEMVHLSGAWARERYIKKRKLEMGIQSIQGLAGTCGGAEHNPFIALTSIGAGENHGEVYGFSLVYSGNFEAKVEVTTHKLTRVTMGIAEQNFTWKLAQGQTFTTPEVVMVYSDKGMNAMSHTYHRLYRKRLCRGEWRDRPRPILLNNWEGTYFDFNEEKILEMAKDARDVGAELFVLDDGWFGARDDDWAGLGDWYCNLKKIPSGIDGLSRKINALGIKFGLWVELEMVNKDSDLYREHPDWMIAVPGRIESHSRHQHVLDYSRKDVVDYIYQMISKIIRESEISYIKWDMNRYMSEPYSQALPADQQGEMMHRYIMGVYDLYNRLTSEFPEILFESCASGGARFDPGMLYFAPQAWCSDDTDAHERCKIQYGTSLVYPIVTMGSHVSTVPNHQLRRVTPLQTRASVAFFGTFGYELVLGDMTRAQLKVVKEQIRFMKKYRELIQIDSDFYRLISPFGHNETAWMVVSQNKKHGIAAFYQRLNRVNGSWLRFRLTGLDPRQCYRVSYKVGERHHSYKIYGDELMNVGIRIDRNDLYRLGGDFVSFLYVLDACRG